MADRIELNPLEGAKELEKLLLQLPEHLRNKIMGPATMAGIKPAVKMARAKIRKLKAHGRDKAKRGTLAKSLVSKLNKRRKGRPYVVAGMGPDKDAKAPGGKEPYNYASYYGMVVEYGWSDTGIAPSKMSVRAGWKKRAGGSQSRPPYPFMRSSIAAIEPTVLADMQKNIGKKIEREAEKLAKKYGMKPGSYLRR